MKNETTYVCDECGRTATIPSHGKLRTTACFDAAVPFGATATDQICHGVLRRERQYPEVPDVGKPGIAEPE